MEEIKIVYTKDDDKFIEAQTIRCANFNVSTTKTIETKGTTGVRWCDLTVEDVEKIAKAVSYILGEAKVHAKLAQHISKHDETNGVNDENHD